MPLADTTTEDLVSATSHRCDQYERVPCRPGSLPSMALAREGLLPARRAIKPPLEAALFAVERVGPGVAAVDSTDGDAAVGGLEIRKVEFELGPAVAGERQSGRALAGDEDPAGG